MQYPAPMYYGQYPGGIPPDGVPPGVIPPGVIEQVCALAAENERLEMKLREKQQAEEAYAKALFFSEDRVYVRGRYGGILELLNCTIDWSSHIYPQAPSRLPPFYVVKLSSSKELLTLTEQEFYSDKLLTARIQELPGVKITIRQSVKRSIALIRQAISCRMETIYIPFYAGWGVGNDGSVQFLVLPEHWTHQNRTSVECPKTLAAFAPAETAMAAARLLPVFTVLMDSKERWLIFLIFHAAILFSLLGQLGFSIPLGFVLFTTEPDVQVFFDTLLSWFDDGSISLELPSQDFLTALISRKDEPALITAVQGGSNSAANTAELLRVQQLQQVPWHNGRVSEAYPLQALTVILTDEVSVITTSPEFIVVDIAPGHFDRKLWLEQVINRQILMDYLKGFVSFTQRNHHSLKNHLDAAGAQAKQLADGRLSKRYLQTLECLLALNRFLSEYTSEQVPVSPLEFSSAEERYTYLAELLVATAEKRYIAADLGELFIEVARSLLVRRELQIFSLKEKV